MESINKGFMLYLKKHFDKEEEYEPILSLVWDIENNINISVKRYKILLWCLRSQSTLRFKRLS
jgi:hypothetical protein